MATALCQPAHCGPERNVPPDGAMVGKPELQMAGKAFGNLFRSVIGTDSL
jgi:hypothetical protein